MPRLTQADLADLNRTFESRTPAELIRWARSIFGSRLAVLSAMQEAGIAVCHMLSRMEMTDVPVLFVDTGVNFPETLETRDRVAADYGLRVVTLTPKQTMAEQIAAAAAPGETSTVASRVSSRPWISESV